MSQKTTEETIKAKFTGAPKSGLPHRIVSTGYENVISSEFGGDKEKLQIEKILQLKL